MDICKVDRDILVPVRPALLMPAPQGMEDLVEHNPSVFTVGTNGDRLGATDLTDEREAAGKVVRQKSQYDIEVIMSELPTVHKKSHWSNFRPQ